MSSSNAGTKPDVGESLKIPCIALIQLFLELGIIFALVMFGQHPKSRFSKQIHEKWKVRAAC